MRTLLWQSTRPSPMLAWRPMSSYGWWPPLFSWKVFFLLFLGLYPNSIWWYKSVGIEKRNMKETIKSFSQHKASIWCVSNMQFPAKVSLSEYFAQIWAIFFFFNKKTTSFLSLDINCGPYEKMLLKHLLYDYERQNRFIVHETSLCEDSEDYFVDFIHNSFFA